jgi:hypothetical protein
VICECPASPGLRRHLASTGGAAARFLISLHVNGQVHDREIIATRIIDLARNGVTDAKALGDRVIAEAEAMRAL